MWNATIHQIDSRCCSTAVLSMQLYKSKVPLEFDFLYYKFRARALRILPAIRNTTFDGLRGWSHQSTSIVLILV